MNEFEERRQRRIERLRARAERAEQEGEATYAQARQMAEVIPMGQPILVGHHSEAGDRRYRDRIAGKFRKAAETQSEAERLKRAADAAEKNGAISSDDPEAVAKLREKLEQLEEVQRRMKACNAAWRKFQKDPAYLAEKEELGLPHYEPHPSGLSPEDRELVRNFKPAERYSWERQPFPSWQLSNNNANIKRVRERIAELEVRATEPEAAPVEGHGFRISEDAEWGRILIEFDGKPSEEVRKYLKSYGWRWAPSRSAWVCHLNNRGRAYAQMAAEKLPGLLLPAGSLRWWATARGFKVFIRACKVWCWMPGRNVAQMAPVDNGRWMTHEDIYAPPWECVELTPAQLANFEAAARDCYCYQGVDRCDFCTSTRTPDGAPSSNGETFWD